MTFSTASITCSREKEKGKKSHFLFLLFYLCLNRLCPSDSVGSFLFLPPENHVESNNHQH